MKNHMTTALRRSVNNQSAAQENSSRSESFICWKISSSESFQSFSMFVSLFLFIKATKVFFSTSGIKEAANIVEPFMLGFSEKSHFE
jgi:hypothetical protein